MKLDTLKDNWVECHYKIVRLIRQGKGTLENPTVPYITEKRKKAKLDCLIELKENGYISKECQECYSFWMNIEPEDNPN